MYIKLILKKNELEINCNVKKQFYFGKYIKLFLS